MAVEVSRIRLWRGLHRCAEQCADWLSGMEYRLRILDAMTHPVPPGVAVILSHWHSTGAGLSGLPIDRQPLYRRSFCPRWSDGPYRDVARCLDNGAVEYLGAVMIS
ncbi:hypothetical protein ACNKHR_04285 [Shigella flexneri]